MSGTHYTYKLESIKRMLKSYFMIAFKAAGLYWGMDNDAEMDVMIDNLLDVIRALIAEELKSHEDSKHFPE